MRLPSNEFMFIGGLMIEYYISGANHETPTYNRAFDRRGRSRGRAVGRGPRSNLPGRARTAAGPDQRSVPRARGFSFPRPAMERDAQSRRRRIEGGGKVP